MRIKGLTEVIDKKLRYPNLAIGGLQFDAKQFQDTPKFSALMRGRIVQVPTNYDPPAPTPGTGMAPLNWPTPTTQCGFGATCCCTAVMGWDGASLPTWSTTGRSTRLAATAT